MQKVKVVVENFVIKINLMGKQKNKKFKKNIIKHKKNVRNFQNSRR